MQKIAVMKKCGHVMCRACIDSFCFDGKKTMDEGKCLKCEKVHSRKDVINLKESGSAFASHSQVEAKVYKPSFLS